VTKRRFGFAATGAVALCCCLLLASWIGLRIHDDAAARAVSSVTLTQRPGQAVEGRSHGPGLRAAAEALASCEARLERGPRQVPTLAIVGASYTAGVGPDNPALSWAVGVARLLHWNAVIDGVPGAGYVRASSTGRGPMSRILTDEALRRLSPALVIVQAGHDDVGVPAGYERQQVGATLDQIRAAAPGAQIALLTTFSAGLNGTPALWSTDRAIVSAGLAADPAAIVMDPLASRWNFTHADGGLHPTAAGDEWIAHMVAGILLAHGIRPAPATGTAPVICDESVGGGQPVTA
jgi:lysophospholipase L1-like esterase